MDIQPLITEIKNSLDTTFSLGKLEFALIFNNNLILAVAYLCCL